MATEPGQRRWLVTTAAWSVLYAGAGAAAALAGVPLFALGAHRLPAALDGAVAAIGLLAGLGCAATHRYGPRPAARWSAARWPVARWSLRTACGLAAVAAFGLLMDLITVAFGEGVDSWPAAGTHLLSATGAVLLAGTLHANAQPLHHSAGSGDGAGRGLAGGSGEGGGGGGRGLVGGRGWRGWGVAVVGTVGFGPYVVMKGVWAAGGTFAGVSGAWVVAVSRRNGASGLWLALESWGVDATVVLAALGVGLLWGLVRPWGRVVPRWVPGLGGRRVPRWVVLGPALVGAASLVPYGVLGVGYLALATAGVLPVRRGDFPTATDALVVSWIGVGAFAVYGVALAVAARRYWRAARRSGAAGGGLAEAGEAAVAAEVLDVGVVHGTAGEGGAG